MFLLFSYTHQKLWCLYATSVKAYDKGLEGTDSAIDKQNKKVKEVYNDLAKMDS